MNKKRILLILASCLIVAGASFGVTYSVLIATDSAVNEFSVGENEIEVVEEFKPPEELDFDDPFVKKVQVKNMGSIPCYVRARVVFSDSFMEDLCTLDYHTGSTYKWVYNEADGYYYYTDLLPVYDKTAKTGVTDYLFEHVTINKTEGVTKEQLVNFDIMVYAESCEAKNTVDENGAEVYESYRQAWNLGEE